MQHFFCKLGIKKSLVGGGEVMVELLVGQYVHLGLVIEGVGPLQQRVTAA